KAGMATSNGEARRTVMQGGVSVDDNKITDPAFSFTVEQLTEGAIVKKGKKSIIKFVIK
ncbi:MAG: tyrosine--tRNA ligase, partial [Clostridia bacterium]|nr:tyrosine--tRNA ligase [Clostridia bacterium]